MQTRACSSQWECQRRGDEFIFIQKHRSEDGVSDIMLSKDTVSDNFARVLFIMINQTMMPRTRHMNRAICQVILRERRRHFPEIDGCSNPGREQTRTERALVRATCLAETLCER